jgi:hypothetical protein
MFKYLEAIEELPQDIKKPFLKVLEIFREEVLDTVKRSDFEDLKNIVSRLAQAQEELAEAQKRTEQRVEELAEAQRRTEEELGWLIKNHKVLRAEVGGLTHAVGYRLEDESFKALPALLKQDMGLEVIGKLKRDFVEIAKGRYIEVNIWGEARYDGKECLVVGEAKTQLKRKDIDDFIKRSDELKKYLIKEQVRILVTYQTSPQVQEYAKAKGIRIFFSYEF